MFTGAADEKIAVTAFNRGLIDRYIKKSDDQALDLLEKRDRLYAKGLLRREQSETLRDLVVLHNYHFLQDPALAAVVQEL